MPMIRCNHCAKDHLEDYCIATGRVPAIDCPESDIGVSDFIEYFNKKKA